MDGMGWNGVGKVAFMDRICNKEHIWKCYFVV